MSQALKDMFKKKTKMQEPPVEEWEHSDSDYSEEEGDQM